MKDPHKETGTHAPRFVGARPLFGSARAIAAAVLALSLVGATPTVHADPIDDAEWLASNSESSTRRLIQESTAGPIGDIRCMATPPELNSTRSFAEFGSNRTSRAVNGSVAANENVTAITVGLFKDPHSPPSPVVENLSKTLAGAYTSLANVSDASHWTTSLIAGSFDDSFTARDWFWSIFWRNTTAVTDCLVLD